MTQPTSDGEYSNNAKLYFNKHSHTYFSHAYRYDGKSDIYQSKIKSGISQKYEVPFKLNDIYPLDAHTILFGGYITKTSNGILGSYDINTRTYNVLRSDTKEVGSINIR